MADLQQSTNWEIRKSFQGFLEDGFPFDEGFPGFYRGKTFTLITRNGTRHTGATVDDSRQYMFEGVEWRTRSRSVVSRGVVIAWCEEKE